MKKNKRQISYYLRIFQKNRVLLLMNMLLTILVSACGTGIALLLKNIIDITVAGDLKGFSRSLLLNLGYLTVYALMYYLNSILSKNLMRRVIIGMRNSVFNGIFRRSYQDFYAVNTADYISVLTNDIKMVEDNYIQPLKEIAANLFSFLFTLILLLFISPMITILLFTGLVLMLLIPGIIGRHLQKKQELLSGGYSVFTAKIKDLFSGFEVIKSFHLFGLMKEQFVGENSILADKKYQTDKLFVLNDTTSQFLALFSQIVTIFAASYLVIKGKITMGTLIALIQLAGSFVMPLVNMIQNFPKIQSVAPVMQRIKSFDDYNSQSGNGRIKPEFRDRITINGVSFAYHDEQPVLEEVNLEFQKGKKYAIVGESGCGKSTLVKLLMGYYSGYTGDILFDQINLRDCEAGKLSEIASIIHQNVYMFDKTIKDNICLFQNYPEEVLKRALCESGVEKFLPSTQNQLETPVGENGASLSGGQRQRIAIARALIKGTPLLILDEGTSAIDQQTSNDIEKNILSNQELTLITITHRLDEELLSLYDQIIYMEKGRIVEIGNYSELYTAGQGFYTFCIA